HLVLFFAASEVMRDGQAIEELRALYPGAHVLGCSTAGEICDTEVTDGTVVATAIHFDHSRVHALYGRISDASHSSCEGRRLAEQMPREGLVHVMVLAEGLNVNGSELAAGLRAGLPPTVAVTGGLAGDGADFKQTSVSLDGESKDGGIALVGFYGDRLRVGYGSLGGWDSFGPERMVTRSQGNILYELDGSSALDLYKEYLGDHAAELPASGLLFPLSLRGEGTDPGLVRTILGINEETRSLVFAGDVPEGQYARLMKANVDRLIDGAQGAAGASYEALGSGQPELAILISCVGRKLVLKQRVEEEPESVREVLGDCVLSGFYSYGEIAPFANSVKCELHNQTMTITTLSER
ncbi:MAG TPA: FIST N-terminal domain-containing protein, partial [Gemmatimonadaceae bacterium]